jgi:signal peptide peptidase SppA
MSDKPTDRDRVRSRVLAAINNEPWAILPEKLELLDGIVADRFLNGPLAADRLAVVEVEARGQDEGPIWSTQPLPNGQSLAVLPIHGVLSKRLGLFERISGGVSSDEIAAAARQLAADDQVAAVALDIDSPGGQVAGTEGAATAIRELAKAKPTIAAVNDLMASGALWIGTAASRILTRNTGMTHLDRSKQYESRGLRPTIITVGRHKAAGADTGPLDDESLAVIRQRLEGIYGSFVEAVAAHRGLAVKYVRESLGDGRVWTGKQALELKLADEIGGLEQVIARLTGEVASARSVSVGVLTVPEANTTTQPPAGGESTSTAAVPATTPATAPTTPGPATASAVAPTAAVPATTEAATLDRAAIEQAAAAAERARGSEIRSLCQIAGVEASVAEQFVASGVSLEACRTRLFEIMGERNKAAQIGAAPAEGGGPAPTQTAEQKAEAVFNKDRAFYEQHGVTLEAFKRSYAKGFNGPSF